MSICLASAYSAYELMIDIKLHPLGKTENLGNIR
jgi:hypothetical protein